MGHIEHCFPCILTPNKTIKPPTLRKHSECLIWKARYERFYE